MKRKKKKKGIQNKHEQRHRQNEFFKKLKQIMAILGDDSAFDLLNKRRRLMIYHTRIRPFKVINPAEGKRTSKAALQMLNDNLTQLLQHTWIELDKQQIRMSLYDFSIYAETLFLFWRNVARQEADVGDRFYACFPIFEEEEFDKQRLKVFNTVERRLELLAWMFSDFTTSTTRFVKEKLADTPSPFDLSPFYNNYVVEQREVETELIELGGHRRTIFRVCINEQQAFIPFTLTPEQLGLQGMMQKLPLKVFIQKHVIVRMEERLGKAFVHLSYLYIITSLLQAPLPAGKPNSLLFPMNEGNIRLGYLQADIIGDKLVVRTFLFVTNNGTPEGKKLQKLAGLAKLDKAYLGIDRLNTFITSDIKDHQQLRALFNQAGCGGLFQLNYSWMIKANKKQGVCADRLACYLGLQQATRRQTANKHEAV